MHLENVGVKYINSQLAITETKISSNFYLSQEDEGVGKDRYDIILDIINKYLNYSNHS